MQSSYNVIKNIRVLEQGAAEINTKFEIKQPSYNDETAVDENRISNNGVIESYENIGKTILDNARKQSDSIINKAYEEARIIEETTYKETYERAYQEGYGKGEEDGYREAYEPTLQKAQLDAEDIINDANNEASNILNQAKQQYDNYIIQNENYIKDMIFSIAESILKREVKDADSLNSMIFDALSNEKNTKSFIIKCNSLYSNSIKEEVESWKNQLAFKGDIFIIEDKTMEEGIVIIEKDNGKNIVSIDYAIEKVREIILENS